MPDVMSSRSEELQVSPVRAMTYNLFKIRPAGLVSYQRNVARVTDSQGVSCIECYTYEGA